MADQQKKILPINYTHREFDTIREDLIEVAERFYPDSFQDFSEASFGSIMLDAVAYVGDQLSFYLDYNVNETFLDTSYQYNNIVRHGRALGYKNTGPSSTYGTVAVFVMVPASSTGIGPDTAYIPILKRGTTFSSVTGQRFVLTENIDFSDPGNPVIVARTNDATGAPEYYAIKAYGNVVSGYFNTQVVGVGGYERFKRVKLTDPNIAEIISVIDSEGNEYFEVEYLSQDIVYQEISNKNYRNDNVPSIIKPILVSRKFIVQRDLTNSYLQFGSGQSGESNVAADPQAAALDIFGKKYTSETSFDPTRLSKNENFGIVPTNTDLTIIYRGNDPLSSNIATGGINEIGTGLFSFEDVNLLVGGTVDAVRESLEVSNETPITGEVSAPTSSEIKMRIFDTFPTQNRAVTQADYENVAYRMPGKFGSIKRCSVQKDPDSLKRNLNMYVISENSQGKLVVTNDTIKNNLKTWLDNYRMINDTIDILDPYIINFGINFVIKTKIGADKHIVLSDATTALREMLGNGFYIGEPMYISDIYSELKNVPGVLDVIRANVVNMNGAGYSSVEFNINQNLSPEGGHLIVPKNAILELKFPSVDIKGRVR